MAVSQDGEQLLKIAEKIKANGENFYRVINDMYDELEKALGENYTADKAWWGPKSEVFLQNARNKREDFEKAKKSVDEMASNLEAQVVAWDSFEA